MKKLESKMYLNEAIAELEKRREKELYELKEEFKLTYESLKPMNVLKSTIKKFTKLPELKNGLTSTSIGLVAGLVARNVFFRSSKNPIKILMGLFIQNVVTAFATRNSVTLSDISQSIMKKTISKFRSNGKKFSEREFNESEIYE